MRKHRESQDEFHTVVAAIRGTGSAADALVNTRKENAGASRTKLSWRKLLYIRARILPRKPTSAMCG